MQQLLRTFPSIHVYPSPTNEDVEKLLEDGWVIRQILSNGDGYLTILFERNIHTGE